MSLAEPSSVQTAGLLSAVGTLLERADGSRVPLDCSVAGPRAALVGDFGALFEAITGDTQVVSGELELLGESPRALLTSGRVGVSLSNLDFPELQSGRELLSTSGYLAGLSRKEAARRGRSLEAELDIADVLERRVAGMSPLHRRLLSLALAWMTSPELLLVEEPMRWLDDDGQVNRVARLLARAPRLIISSPNLERQGPGAQLWMELDEVVVVSEGQMVERGTPAELAGRSTRHRVRVLGGLAEFVHELQQLRVTVIQSSPELGGGGRALLDLEGQSTALLFATAARLGSPIVELTPC